MQKSHEDIVKEREALEKQARAREAREKNDAERALRAAKKKAFVDFNAPDDQEGVMDSLLEALKTGSAFNREGKRGKRPPRSTGGMDKKLCSAFNFITLILCYLRCPWSLGKMESRNVLLDVTFIPFIQTCQSYSSN